MKYFAPPILAVLLMGWPTVSSLISLLKGNPATEVVGEASASLERAQKTAAAELEKILKVRVDLDALATATAKPYGPGASPKLGANSDFAAGWAGYAKIRDELGTAPLEVLGGFPDPASQEFKSKTPEEIQGQIDRVKQLADGAKQEAIKKIAADKLRRLNEGLIEVQRNASNDNLLREARELFAGRNYQGVIEKLKPWKGELAPEAKSLLGRATFQVQAGPLWKDCVSVAASCSPQDWKPLIPRLNSLLKAGDPASAEEDEKLLYDQLRRALASFQVREALAQLSTSPLGIWAQRAKQSLASGGDKFAWDCAKQRLRSVIDSKLPPTKRTADEGFQEAVSTNGARLLGTFQLQVGGNWFKHWYPTENVQRTDGHIVMAKDLKEQPGVPLTVRCITEYKEARQRLLGHDPLNALPGQCAERSSWEAFQTTCQRLAGELKNLQKDVSFENELKFAQEVLSSWDPLADFLRP